MEISKSTKCLLFVLGILVAISFFAYSATTGTGDILEVSFLDVGQGDAILIETPSGRDILIDGGKGDSVLSRLRDELPFFDKSIDLVIATHPDRDHAEGLLSVFDAYQVGTFMASAVKADTDLDENILGKSKVEKSVTIFPRRDTVLVLDPIHDITLHILFPDRDTADWPETNEASIVARLVYGDTSIMLTGDSPMSVEQFLVGEYGAGLESDVLKLGHHGSKTSSAPLFLAAVSPEYAVVSSGRGNSYGHPDPMVVSRAESYGATVLDTQDLGTIRFISDGKIVRRK